MMQIDAISAAYIELAFAIEQHVEGFIDAYFGPPELRQAARREPAAIAAAVAALRDEVRASGYPAQRKSYLEAQLRGMETTARRLAGEAIAYRDEVRACFDIEPVLTPESTFEAANAELEALMPGPGSLAERLAAWRDRFVVSPEVAEQMIAVIVAEARARTSHELIAMPEGDAVRFALVSDKPWSGYNWYLGDSRSLVEINTDLPIRAGGLLDLVCHEAYPGHHAEHALKEQRLYRERGWGEQAIQLINVPECVISEGIATLAADMVFGDDASTWAAEHIYPLAGITGDPERETRIAAAQWTMRAISGNAALLLHEQGADPEEVVAYLMRYGLRSEREARQSLRFISTPLWRTYTFTYYVGRELLGRWLAAGNRNERYVTLLTEQVYPSMLQD
jgi:hypothetical protein